jgi:hypothetical protein
VSFQAPPRKKKLIPKQPHKRIPSQQQQEETKCPSHVPLNQDNTRDEYKDLYEHKPNIVSERLPATGTVLTESDARNMGFQESTESFSKQFENQLPIQNPLEEEDFTYSNGVESVIQEPVVFEKKPEPKPTHNIQPYPTQQDKNLLMKPLGSSILDLFLYVISGILLIFVMDQFVQLGRLG